MALGLVGLNRTVTSCDPAGCGTLCLLRKEFVAAFVQYAFNDSVEGTFREFQRGFFKVCSMKVVDIFQLEELQLVMVGQEDDKWDQFKQVGSWGAGGSFSCRFLLSQCKKSLKKQFYNNISGLFPPRTRCTMENTIIPTL